MTINIDDRALLQLALVGYGLPILCMVLSMLVFSAAASVLNVDPSPLLSPVVAAFGFIGGLIACQPLSRLMSRRMSANKPKSETGQLTGHGAEHAIGHGFITIRGHLPTV